jgi:Tfp pilus assembly protein PilV
MDTKMNCVEKNKGQAGFSLIEVMVSFSLLMVTLGGVLCLFLYAIFFNAGSGEQSLGMAIAQQQVEMLRAVEFDDALLDETDADGNSVDLTNNNRPFVVTTIIDDTTPTLKNITIKVVPVGVQSVWARSGVTVVTQRSALTSGSKFE